MMVLDHLSVAPCVIIAQVTLQIQLWKGFYRGEPVRFRTLLKFISKEIRIEMVYEK